MFRAMTSTDVGAQISAWISGSPRETIIHTHGIPVPLAFWDVIADLPGAPLTGEPLRNGSVRIDRGQLFTLARSVEADETGAAALRLLWHVLAWGSDTRNWNNIGRVEAVAKDPAGAGKLLREAAIAARTDPEKAFRILHPGTNAKGVLQPNTVGSLGPNFSTKFLYFAGVGNTEHPCLIVDKRVMGTLHRITQDHVYEPAGTNYGYFRYEAALKQMTAWAREASTTERPVAPDEVELWAYRQR